MGDQLTSFPLPCLSRANVTFMDHRLTSVYWAWWPDPHVANRTIRQFVHWVRTHCRNLVGLYTIFLLSVENWSISRHLDSLACPSDIFVFRWQVSHFISRWVRTHERLLWSVSGLKDRIDQSGPIADVWFRCWSHVGLKFVISQSIGSGPIADILVWWLKLVKLLIS